LAAVYPREKLESGVQGGVCRSIGMRCLRPARAPVASVPSVGSVALQHAHMHPEHLGQSGERLPLRRSDQLHVDPAGVRLLEGVRVCGCCSVQHQRGMRRLRAPGCDHFWWKRPRLIGEAPASSGQVGLQLWWIEDAAYPSVPRLFPSPFRSPPAHMSPLARSS